MGDRLAAALTHRREDLLEIGTGIDGNDPWTDVDRDSPAEAFTPPAMIAPTIGMKLARWNVARRTAAAFPTT
jgi:hypothetical protein